MSNILERDRTGRCEGECVDRVREGEAERQAGIREARVPTPEAYPDVPWAHSRNEPPGAFGGHV